MPKMECIVTDEGIIRSIPIPQCGPNVYKEECVITKEAFIKAYKMYILGEKENKDD